MMKPEIEEMVDNQNKQFAQELNKDTEVGKMMRDMKELRERFKLMPDMRMHNDLQATKADNEEVIEA